MSGRTRVQLEKVFTKAAQKLAWSATKSAAKLLIDYGSTSFLPRNVLEYAADKGIPGAAKAVKRFAKGGFGCLVISDLTFFICEWGVPYDTRFGFDPLERVGR